MKDPSSESEKARDSYGALIGQSFLWGLVLHLLIAIGFAWLGAILSFGTSGQNTADYMLWCTKDFFMLGAFVGIVVWPVAVVVATSRALWRLTDRRGPSQGESEQ